MIGRVPPFISQKFSDAYCPEKIALNEYAIKHLPFINDPCNWEHWLTDVGWALKLNQKILFFVVELKLINLK